MGIRFHWTRIEWDSARRHLLQNDDEQVVAVFGRVEIRNPEKLDEISLVAIDSYHCVPTDFSFQSSYHIELAHETQARLIKRAWDVDCALIELHSHVGRFASAAFSPSDLSGFEEFVPHVRWRLRGKPYLAIVVTAAEFDALAWLGDSLSPQPLECIQLENFQLRPTNRFAASPLANRPTRARGIEHVD
jgi:hypothetical protein